MSKQALVIYNPTARSQGNEDSWLSRLVAELGHQDNYVVTLYPTNPETTSDSIVSMLKPELDLVVAAGGDGTIRSVLAAMGKSQCKTPVALMPLGTGNVLARNLGIVDEKFFVDPLARAFEPISNGVPVQVDMGVMNGHYFAGMAGAGPLSDAFMKPARKAKTTFKNLAYAKAMIETLAERPIIFKITTAGRTFTVHASGVFVANVEDLGYGKPCDLHTLTDGYLNLHILNPRNFHDYVSMGFRFAAGQQEGDAKQYSLRVKDAEIEVIPQRGLRSHFQSLVTKIICFLEGKPVAEEQGQFIKAMLDGEEVGTTPMKITVVPQAVTILVPAQKVKQSEQSQAEQSANAAQKRIAMQGAAAAAIKGGYEPGEITAFITNATKEADSVPASSSSSSSSSSEN